MTTKRQINGTKYNVAELVDRAIAAAASRTFNLERERQELGKLGHINADDETTLRYAQNKMTCYILADYTGVGGFKDVVGKLDFQSRETIITGVQEYLDRRIAGQHSQWTKSHSA